jgi:hypothetical protein
MPAALTELLGTADRRVRVDLTDCDKCRLTTRVVTVGAAAAVLKVQYSTDEAAWADLTPAVAVNTTGAKATAWAAVPAGARGDVFLRVVGQSGDGAADPVFGQILLEAR